jgi:hypothetical protein
LAQSLKIRIQRRLAGLRAATGKSRGSRRRRGLRVFRESHKVLLRRRQIAALQVRAKLLKIGEKLRCVGQHRLKLAHAAGNSRN